MSAPHPYELAKDYDHAERLARGGDGRGALRMSRAALEMARASGDDAMVRRGLNTVAVCQNAASRFIEAIAAATDAYHLSIEAGDLRECTNALATLVGMTGFLYPLPDAGISILDECLANALQIGDRAIEARVRMFRAMRLGGLGRFEEADAEFATLMTLAGQHDIKMPNSMLALNWLALAIRIAARRENGQGDAWDVALARYAEAIDYARFEYNELAELRAEANLVHIEFARGNAASAVDAIERCLALGRHLQQFHLLGDLHFMHAQHCDKQRDAAGARAAYLEAYTCAEHSLPNPGAAESAAQLARLARESADGGEAAIWQEREQSHRAAYARERENARMELEHFFNGHQQLRQGASSTRRTPTYT